MAMFERTLFHVLRVILQTHTARWAEQVPDMTKPQFAVLEALDRGGELDQAALSRASATSKATLAEMLNRMERRGLIARRADPGDARQKRVHLTAAGATRLREVRPVADRVNDGFTATLSEAERETLLNLLAKLRRRAEETE
ncbi:Transcriptional regulator HosA [wastewater metagenome]|uniref:Transcriptional regulator HosA n=2 Tax=unclassified sequences TaxID=12908 RepID=A0A5B8RAS7_9ZZZZ|nr:MarR family transcriptional regulator [Arhodomonas sp. KWT]QEA05173.1 transcriptional regulator HosA [uncultured organism]